MLPKAMMAVGKYAPDPNFLNRRNESIRRCGRLLSAPSLGPVPAIYNFIPLKIPCRPTKCQLHNCYK